MQWTNQNLNTCSWSEARENMWKSGSNFLASRAVMQTQLLFDAQRNTALKWISLNVHQCSLSLEEFVNRFTSYRRRKSTFKSSAWSCLSVSLFVCLFVSGLFLSRLISSVIISTVLLVSPQRCFEMLSEFGYSFSVHRRRHFYQKANIPRSEA